MGRALSHMTSTWQTGTSAWAIPLLARGSWHRTLFLRAMNRFSRHDLEHELQLSTPGMYFHTKGGTCSVSYRLIKLVSYLWQVTAHRSSCLSSAVNKIGRKSNTKFEKWAEVALTSMPWRKCKAELFSWNADCLPNVTAFARKTIEKTCKLPPNS